METLTEHGQRDAELQPTERVTYHCVRVYPNGEARSTIRDADGLKLWLRANRTFRTMCALFVDGRPPTLSDYGQFSAEQVARIQFSLEAHALQVDRTQVDVEPAEVHYPSLAYEVGESRVVH